MRVRRLHHVSLHVADLERAAAFYCGVLGLTEIERPSLPCPGAWFSAGDCELHLLVSNDVPAPRPARLSPFAVHAAFSIDDYETTLAEVRAAGIEVLDTSPAVGQMWLLDPDGNVIELIAR